MRLSLKVPVIDRPESYHTNLRGFGKTVPGPLSAKRFGADRRSEASNPSIREHCRRRASWRSGRLPPGRRHASGLGPIGKVVATVQRLGRSNWRGFRLDIVFRCVQIGSIHARTLDLVPAILMVQVAGTRRLERRLTCGRD